MLLFQERKSFFMNINDEIATISNRLHEIAQERLPKTDDNYSKERFEELEIISQKLKHLSHENISTIKNTADTLNYMLEDEPVSKRFDVRAIIFNEYDEVLLVQESDGTWAPPGGWSDVGYSVDEVAIKETQEETGLHVIPKKVCALFDMQKQKNPTYEKVFCYKVFIMCEVVGGSFNDVFDIKDKKFFKRNEIPPLSLERTIPSQLEMMFEYHFDPNKPTYID
ncbi:putative ADP-ribose pyrophosphatase YjhB [Tritrichomonas foetus]|uniref:ADP-ribose pyrophosphatase YjhB n=1 Tax=Tritrichomonas foetus TaxID=1144522 RepID=A0A1J4JQ34_9EUKA|nr:putative ADP-ribose pyrophosphatase YjhB [Tritrichomonas foetus]|eukprot:OHS99340.1 putative ADP-ribose pyrophosphatase YjhB [Tritrichomonas foetus]